MPSNFRILVVDDEPFFRSVLATFLKRLKFEVREAEDAEQAYAKLHQFDPHVVLLDIMMPGESGTDVVKTIKESKPDCEVIMVTGVPSDETRSECLRKGAFAILSKPVELDVVKETVSKAIEKTQGAS